MRAHRPEESGARKPSKKEWVDRDSNRDPEDQIGENVDGLEGSTSPSDPSDRRPTPRDLDQADESKTIPESLDVRELLGPPNLPGPLYDPPPRNEAGEVDWGRLLALVRAVEALVGAGMAYEARPLVGQLRGIVEAARGPSAKVIELGAKRST